MQISIIIPYYKTYDLTKRLMNNLEKQLNDNVEIIIVDDGCNETRLDSTKATVIHLKENKGVSNARNVGLKIAKGKYISFIDSDDNVSDDYITTLLKEIDGTDIIYFNWQTQYGDIRDLTKGIPEWNYAVWKAIYRKDICPIFNQDLRKCEDVFFQNDLDKNDYSKKFINKVLYIYTTGRQGSLTNGGERNGI